MKEIALEIPVCIIAAALIMVIHELSKSVVYLCVRKIQRQEASHNNSILAVWRYIDPLGLLLSATCFVPFSKPHLFRIRDKKTNMVLGITGFTVLLLLFISSIAVLRTGCLGMDAFLVQAAWFPVLLLYSGSIWQSLVLICLLQTCSLYLHLIWGW